MPARRTPLAVLLPEIGLASETFIRWDIERLLPSGTAVVADPPPGGLSVRGATTWSLSDQPALVFDPVDGDPDPSGERIASVLSFLEQHCVSVVLLEYLDFADRWFEPLHRAGLHIWVRGHGVDLSARLREQRWVTAYRRLAAADGILVPSRHARAILLAIGLPELKVHVVRYPVEVPPLPHRSDGPDVRCVAVGRLVAKKAPLLMLEAFRLAHHVDPLLTLDLVGDGPLSDDVRTFVSANGLAGQVRLHGRLAHDQALRILRRSDIPVDPRRSPP
ncbi:MAG: colanic acid/amylovoran biosynthesis glycosyltransferase [Micromonosporaceae bacterium]|jgi:glycosyltransferase involved in cell wall biosynthesis|nr:colanic acid/amylovoran biosynthesis glycosyltransferase [Micromonosporaceae bacterium]